MGGGFFLVHSLVIIKWTWRVFSQKICNLIPPLYPQNLAQKSMKNHIFTLIALYPYNERYMLIHAFFISNTFISNARVKLTKKIKQILSNILTLNFSIVKCTDSGHFLKEQGKFIFSFPCTLFFTYFWHLKITNWAFKKSPGLLHFTLLWQGKKILFFKLVL